MNADGVDMSVESLPEASIPDSWGVSDMKVTSVKYLWAIRNFTFWDRKGNNHLDSPVFFAEGASAIKWRLRLQSEKLNVQNVGHYLEDRNNIRSDPKISLHLYLESSDKLRVKAKCKFSIMNSRREKIYSQNNLEDFHTFKTYTGGSSLKIKDFIQLEYLLKDDANLLADGNLTIFCEISVCMGCVNVSSPRSRVVDLRASNENARSDDFGRLLDSGQLSDVTLNVGPVEGPRAQLRAHKAVLAARSPVFSAMFNHHMRETERNVIDVVDFDELTMRQVLRYFYTDQLPLEGDDEEVARMSNLLAVADKYEIESLRSLCVEALSKGVTSIEKAGRILHLGELYKIQRLVTRASSFLMAHGRDPLRGIDIADRSFGVRSQTQMGIRRVVKKQIIDRLFK